ncbi:hypothetical protein F5Y01DRAFT_123172 [Xylaria sp. FL0043]|nr:hypothetical protein F5Y01DRAFT_123172 [Xylaria sp. FL0043]
MSRYSPPSNLREQQGKTDDDDDDSNKPDDTNNDGHDHDGHEKEERAGEGQSSTTQGDDDEDDDDNNDAIDDTGDLADDDAEIQKTISCGRRQRKDNIQDLLPFLFSPLIRPLTISDLESCVALENAAFPNLARCSRDKFVYRLTVCPELCMGVFCTVVPSNAKGWEIDTLHTAHAVETGRDDGAVSVLLAHIVATRSHDDVVTDEAMECPHDKKNDADDGEDATRSSKDNDGNSDGDEKKDENRRIGHQEFGRTVCIHSVAVHPKLQGVGLGKLIVKAYVQQVKNSALASRIALVCQEYLINYFKRFGFSHNGPSKAKLGGDGWNDMVLDLGSLNI